MSKSSRVSLYEQIYDQILERIVSGAYQPGSKVPSIRNLADVLQCSCNTVSAAYKLLVQEGFLVSHPGSGFYVTDDGVFLGRMRSEKVSSDALERKDGAWSYGRTDGQSSCRERGRDETPLLFNFTYRDLEPGSFPVLEWKALIDDILLSPIAVACNFYTDSEGERHLREEIARQIAVSRDIQCEPEQIIVQAGTQVALQNLLMLFDSRTDSVAMEDPGYAGARLVFERCRFSMVSCPVIDDEVDFASAVENSGARLAYTTPSNQFPMGTVMNESTRQRLLAWAHRADAYIIEDDYCHELNYRNKVQPALRTLDQHDRVIYMGTFSKTLSPALRINYMILPEALLERWRRCFDDAYSVADWLTQEALARYLGSDRYSRHIRRMLMRNKRKYEVLKAALEDYMGDRVNVIEGGAGLHMLVEVKDGRPQDELMATARSAGVAVYSTEQYWMTPRHPLESCVLVGFSEIEESLIASGIERLAHAWFGDEL